MRVDGLDHLVVVVADALELVVKVVQPGHELRLRGVVSHDDELLAEDAADDKAAAVLLRPGLGKHPPETEVLFFVQAEGVLVAPRPGFISFSHYHHQSKSGATRERRNGPAGRAFLSDKRQFVGQKHSSLPSGDGMDRTQNNPPKIFKIGVPTSRVSPRRRLPLRGDAAGQQEACVAMRAGCAPGAILR